MPEFYPNSNSKVSQSVARFGVTSGSTHSQSVDTGYAQVRRQSNMSYLKQSMCSIEASQAQIISPSRKKMIQLDSNFDNNRASLADKTPSKRGDGAAAGSSLPKRNRLMSNNYDCSPTISSSNNSSINSADFRNTVQKEHEIGVGL